MIFLSRYYEHALDRSVVEIAAGDCDPRGAVPDLAARELRFITHGSRAADEVSEIVIPLVPPPTQVNLPQRREHAGREIAQRRIPVEVDGADAVVDDIDDADGDQFAGLVAPGELPRVGDGVDEKSRIRFFVSLLSIFVVLVFLVARIQL